jgi:hypothetical protein
MIGRFIVFLVDGHYLAGASLTALVAGAPLLAESFIGKQTTKIVSPGFDWTRMDP